MIRNIYILHSQRFNHDDLDDDPKVLMGLPPLEKTSEFWKRYDRQADTHDNKMTQDLSENLDVLLIFAALFSAINTAFISLTMPGLSPDPQAETNTLLRLLVTRADNTTLTDADLYPPFTLSSNSVAVNCLLYGSLSCSLLAAMGAMMGKEWLQSFDRTGQTGPLEEQGRFRQRKFNGVRQWHLEPIVRSLPNILLLSVALFFAGVCLFLFPVNKTVAGVVIAFSGGGAALCGVAIVAGATSPLCPYQSAASRALKRSMILFSLRWWKGLARAAVDFVVRGPQKLVQKVFDATQSYPRVASMIQRSLPTALLSTTLSNVIIPDQTEAAEAAQAAGWLFETTSNRADQIAAAQFVCTLDRTACVFAFEGSETRRRLVFLTHEAFDIWHSRPSGCNQEIAELLGLVLCRVLLQPPKEAAKRIDLSHLRRYDSRSFGGTFLRAFEFASTKYSHDKFEDKEMILHIAFLLAVTSTGPVSPEYQWIGLSRFFLTGNTPQLVDVLLGLWAKMFCNMDPDRRSFHQIQSFEGLVDTGDTKGILTQDLSNAVIRGTRVLSSLRGDVRSAVQGYTACLQRVGELSTQISHHELSKVVDGVVGFILSYVGNLTSKPEEPSLDLVRVSIEAVLALHALITKKTRPNEIPASQAARAEQLRIDDLIDAAARIMLDDPESHTSSTLLPRTPPQLLARARALALARAGEEWEGEQVWEWVRDWLRERVRVRERVGEQVRKRAPAPGELTREPARELALELAVELADALAEELVGDSAGDLVEDVARTLALTLARTLPSPMHRALLSRELDEMLGKAVDKAVDEALDEALDDVWDWMPRMADDLAQRLEVESSIIRILLWVWKRMRDTQPDNLSKHKMFLSSCRLWAPLEMRVDFSIHGIEWGIKGERLTFNDDNRNKVLTPEDLNGIVGFVEDLQKDTEKSAFIIRNANVEINKLCAHFNRRVDWNYNLYDLREPRTLCSRSTIIENKMI